MYIEQEINLLIYALLFNVATFVYIGQIISFQRVTPFTSYTTENMETNKTKQILIVDDDPDYIYLVERALADCVPACNLKVLSSGVALLEWLETDPVRPNLILLDINMPVSNGFEVLNVLRSVDRYKMIPVVMLSSSESKEDIGKSYDRGANAYLVKPAGFSELKRHLDFFNYYWFDISKTPSANWGDINWYNELN